MKAFLHGCSGANVALEEEHDMAEASAGGGCTPQILS
jgi:hypothetical protein